jgi:hypothetical protein
MILVKVLDPRVTPEHLGIIPGMLNSRDPRPAREQFDEHYVHGGGWRPFQGFTMNPETFAIKYPGDPAHKALAEIVFRPEERIFFYESAWVAIVQKDGTYEISRMD